MANEKKTILIIDDDPNIREIVGVALEDMGYVVVSVPDGESALSLAEQRVFDLFVLDIGMPGMDGMEVCRRLKQTPLSATTPIVFLTAQHELSQKISAFLKGGRRFITKPFDLKHLLEAIETVINSEPEDI